MSATESAKLTPLLRGYKHKSLPLECRVYRPEDLCPLLGIGRSTAYELVNRRDFPTIRVGRKILIPRDAFEKWLEAQTAEAFSQEA